MFLAFLSKQKKWEFYCGMQQHTWTIKKLEAAIHISSAEQSVANKFTNKNKKRRN
jgi:hypothetical protein